MESQINTLKQRHPATEVHHDIISSGLRFDKLSFSNLLRVVQEKRGSKATATHRERLTRFGFNYPAELGGPLGATVETVFYDIENNSIQEMVEDVTSV